MEELVKYLLLILFSATVCEGLIEFLVTPILDALLPSDVPKNVKARTVVFNFLSAGLGVVIAVSFHLETFKLLGGASDYSLVDSILTGALLGRGANWIHTLIQTYFLKKEAIAANIAEATAEVNYYTKHTPE